MSRWSEFFEDNLGLIKAIVAAVCRKKRVSADQAQDFQSHVFLRLIENDYKILRNYKGKSSLKAYLSVVILNLYRDYQNALLGKWRASARARALGRVAVVFEQLTIRDRYTFDEAFELLRTNHQFEIAREALERIAAQLPARLRPREVSDEALIGLPSHEPPADIVAADAELDASRRAIFDALDKTIATFDVQDQLILKFVYYDGLRVVNVARLVKVPQKKLYVRLDTLRARLRKMLAEQRFELE